MKKIVILFVLLLTGWLEKNWNKILENSSVEEKDMLKHLYKQVQTEIR